MKTEDIDQIRSVLALNLKEYKAKSKRLIEKEKNLSSNEMLRARYYDGMAKAYRDAIKLIDTSLKSSRDSEVKNFYPVISMRKQHLSNKQIEGDTAQSVTTLCGVYLYESIVVLSPTTKENATMNEDICLNCRRSALKS